MTINELIYELENLRAFNGEDIKVFVKYTAYRLAEPEIHTDFRKDEKIVVIGIKQ